MSIASQNDIEAWFLTLRTMTNDLAGSDMKPAEQEKVKVLAEVGLRIVESIVIYLNLIGYHLGELVEVQNRRS